MLPNWPGLTCFQRLLLLWQCVTCLKHDSAAYKEDIIEHTFVNPFSLISNTPRNHGPAWGFTHWNHTVGGVLRSGMGFSSDPLLAFPIFGDRRPLHASGLCSQHRPRGGGAKPGDLIVGRAGTPRLPHIRVACIWFSACPAARKGNPASRADSRV